MKKYIVLIDVPNYQKFWDSFDSLDEALCYKQEMAEIYWTENPKITIITFDN